MKKKAVILLSGGLDSAVALYIARSKGYDCHCLIFDYGQRHSKEIECAKTLAKASGSKFKVQSLRLQWKGSSLLDKDEALPLGRTVNQIKKSSVPSTYVPARNTVFLSIAASYAEAIGAASIFIGAHSEDSSGYPDCRIEYLEAFDRAIALGTKAGSEGRLKLEFPLIKKSKAQIIKTGLDLGVPFGLTWSCYSGGSKPCMRCDSCILRAGGFKEALVSDPLTEGKTGARAVVTEIFSSIQGEGIYVGARQIFVRFKRCNLGCDFCDTPDTIDGKEYSVPELMCKIKALDKGGGPHHSVSLTGGEPLLQAEFLGALLPLLKRKGFKTYLETNGTLPESLKRVIDFVDIVAMDFKLPSSTKGRLYWKEHLDFLKIASRKKVFVKVVVTANTAKSDIEKAITLIKKVSVRIPFVIQPVTPIRARDKQVPVNRLSDFRDMAIRGRIVDTRIIGQVHKLLGVK